MADTRPSSDASSGSVRTCPACGAPLVAGQTTCWLCFEPDSKTTPSAKPVRRRAIAPVPASPAAERSGGFSLASLMMFVTLACVLFGVFTISPGLGVPLAIVAVITWVRTVSEVKSRATVGQTLTSIQILLLFLRSVAFALLILTLVGVAAVAALATFCFGLMSAADPQGKEMVGLFLVAAVVLIVAIVGLAVARRFGQRRW